MPPQREWFDVDYYKTLGVSKEASDKEITRAYRKLAKQYHPDAHPGSENRFKEITAAYDVLGDAEKRKEYDEVRRLGSAGYGFGTPQGGGAGFDFRVEDLSDLFGGLFRGQTAGRRRGAGPQRGGDVEADLHLSFEEAIHGVVTTVNVSSRVTCSTCGGSGSRPGSHPIVCPSCNGRGVLNDNQGLFSLSSPCPECAGRGTKIVDPCPTCQGSGYDRRQRSVKVRIPAGVDNGQKIRVKGRGEPGRNNGPAGDLFVSVSVSPHPLFGRRSHDLLLTVPITYPELSLGAEITVPSLDRPVTLKVPPGTKPGTTFRVRGKGLSYGGRRGDLLVTVELVVPRNLSDAERSAVEALREAQSGDPRSHLHVDGNNARA